MRSEILELCLSYLWDSPTWAFIDSDGMNFKGLKSVDFCILAKGIVTTLCASRTGLSTAGRTSTMMDLTALSSCMLGSGAASLSAALDSS